VEARVVAGEDGRPVEGADVWLYAYDWGQGRRHHRVEAKRSDAAGLVRFDYAAAAGRPERSYFLLAHRGKDYALDPSYLSLAEPREPSDETASLVYTDRSIYRPQQKVPEGQPTVAADPGVSREGRRRLPSPCATPTTRRSSRRPRHQCVRPAA
jgi:hypothetical protein